MFCQKCGEQLLEGDVFCPKCGWKAEFFEESDAEGIGKKKEKAGKKSGSKKTKWVIGLVGVVIVVAIVAFCITLLPKMTRSNGGEVIEAFKSGDDSVVLSLENGKSITVEEASRATMTADGQHLIVLYTDKSLYIMDKNQKERVCVADKCKSYAYVRNDGFYYEDSKGKVYRVKYKDGSTVLLEDLIYLTVAPNTTTALYRNSRHQMMQLNHTSDVPEKISAYKLPKYIMDSLEKEDPLVGEEPEADQITDEGDMALWVEGTDDGQASVWCYEDGIKSKILENDDDDIDLYHSKDQGTCVIETEGKIWIKRRGEEPISVGKPSGSVYNICTAEGYIEDVNVMNKDYIYFEADASEKENFYVITPEGDRERLLANVFVLSIGNGRIVWKDEDDSLYHGKLEGAKISDETCPVYMIGEMQMMEDF
ncbi:MAG: zinc-ribbon domain-containing protein [Lachnospiraceae bacterium]|nr:zinc-ribbon domain-containing protein [Lachnospiraceae bacterium]